MSTLLTPPGISSEQLKTALERCEVVAAKDRSNLYVTSQFFEERARYDAFIAMYAVMRLVDDFIDNVPDKSRLSPADHQRLISELDTWEKRIRDAYDGKPSSDPIDVGLAAAALTFPVPIKVWLNFIEAMRFDVRHPRFKDFAEFLSYGEGATVAPTVIYVYLLTATRESSGKYLVQDFDYETCGRELGLFAYLAHILRDVAEDMKVGETGLVYLTLDDMKAFQLDEGEVRKLIARKEGDERWRGLVRELCGRAHRMEDKGVALAERQYGKMAQDCAFILNLIIVVYQELLRRIEARPDAVLVSDPMMGQEEKAILAAGAAQKTGYPLEKVAAKMSR